MNQIEICNIALGRIGVETIERIDEASEAARVCRRFYDFVRQTVLRRFPWTFAAKRVRLALLEQQPPDYKYAYRYPSDALYLRHMFNDQFQGLPRSNEYKLIGSDDGRIIFTNIPDAWIEYTADAKDPTFFDAQFVEAFAWKLAAEISFALTGNMGITQNCVQAYNAYFMDAAGDDANEENVLDPQLDRLAAARFTGA